MIYLIGFMGVGKTTVGKALQKELHLPFFDTDEEIVKKANMIIPKIFETYGEEEFRKMETNVLKELAQKKDGIVSCGGGVVLREENVDIMKQSGTIILLEASAKNILQRVKNDTSRPLLKGKKSQSDIEDMMKQRLPFYEKAKDISIATGDCGVKDSVREILLYLQGIRTVNSAFIDFTKGI